jgi:AcrR family transcriptional regulator
MTIKRDTILQAALQLFSERGFNATSTSKVAQKAGVSEGLIFRHFKNKEGLLEAILEMGKERAAAIFLSIKEESDPKERLRFILSIPSNIPQEEYPFWRLLYALKWRTDHYDAGISDPILEMLEETFKELAYPSPKEEAQLLMMLIDGMATALLLKKVTKLTPIQKLLFKKYKL